MAVFFEKLSTFLSYRRSLPVCEEYLLYGYPVYEADRFGRNKWHFIAAYPAAEACLENARHLMKNAGYARLEIKRRYICAKNQKTYFKTYAVLGRSLNRHKYLIVGSGAIALFCALQYYFNFL
jgi:hypothetical protein